MRFRKSAHSVYKTEYHVVWTPRYRRNLFSQTGVKAYAEKVLHNIENLEDDIEVKKMNVRPDHIHIIIIIPPRVSVASVIQFIKTQSSGKIKSKYSFLQKAIWGRSGIWSRGYYVSSIGMNKKNYTCLCFAPRERRQGATETRARVVGNPQLCWGRVQFSNLFLIYICYYICYYMCMNPVRDIRI